jgi:hypothetical protein
MRSLIQPVGGRHWAPVKVAFTALKLLLKQPLCTLASVSRKSTGKRWTFAPELHRQKGLPDIAGLLRDLNDARKAAAYGDVERPDLHAEGIASQIEQYVDAVAALLTEDGDNE